MISLGAVYLSCCFNNENRGSQATAFQQHRLDFIILAPICDSPPTRYSIMRSLSLTMRLFVQLARKIFVTPSLVCMFYNTVA
ncbi:hypothetical protein K443DRAFT_314018 [Laccaria amethystina LaAM-08-1]|uniref:Unplaced genomic scaffold K443scaffold_206, whole genome shotgun sequence n=1 Tax=Laccaria amethystina LaAM-08-1 TaxID=1095629 RepID=A0A0C9XDP9_9AGAR|nr:hypothetical protein K443DRAFT_314018 [Laccaria amethystina LaAM-08-1]